MYGGLQPRIEGRQIGQHQRHGGFVRAVLAQPHESLARLRPSAGVQIDLNSGQLRGHCIALKFGPAPRIHRVGHDPLHALARVHQQPLGGRLSRHGNALLGRPQIDTPVGIGELDLAGEHGEGGTPAALHLHIPVGAAHDGQRGRGLQLQVGRAALGTRPQPPGNQFEQAAFGLRVTQTQLRVGRHANLRAVGQQQRGRREGQRAHVRPALELLRLHRSLPGSVATGTRLAPAHQTDEFGGGSLVRLPRWDTCALRQRGWSDEGGTGAQESSAKEGWGHGKFLSLFAQLSRRQRRACSGPSAVWQDIQCGTQSLGQSHGGGGMRRRSAVLRQPLFAQGQRNLQPPGVDMRAQGRALRDQGRIAAWRVHIEPAAATGEQHAVKPQKRALQLRIQGIYCGPRNQYFGAQRLVRALQACSGVDRITNSCVCEAFGGPHVPHRSFAGVHADPQAHCSEGRATPVAAQQFHVGLHGLGASQPTGCVGSIGQGRIPEGHDRIANEFVQGGAMGPHAVRHAREIGVEGTCHSLRRQRFAGRGKTCKIAKQQSQHAPLTMHMGHCTGRHQRINDRWWDIAREIRTQALAAAALAQIALGSTQIPVHRQTGKQGQYAEPPTSHKGKNTGHHGRTAQGKAGRQRAQGTKAAREQRNANHGQQGGQPSERPGHRPDPIIGQTIEQGRGMDV